MKIKKIILLIPAFLILIPMFLSATGGKEGPKPDVTLTYLGPDSHGGSNEDQLMYQEWMNATGIKVAIEKYSGGQERLNTLLATGDTPDMMVCTRDIADSYGMQGAFVAINEYFNIAPNLKRYLSIENNPYLYAPDGNLYFMPGTGFPYLNMGWLWRQDWADKLGIATPKTIDDWAAAWRKVKNDDPESIPWLTAWSESPEQFITLSWGIGGNWSSKYTFENGIIKYPWVSEKMKEVISFIHDMYAEGILWSEYLTASGERRTAAMASGKVFSHLFYMSSAFSEKMSTPEMRDNTVAVAPPVGPYGDSGCDWLGVVSFWGQGICSTCKNIPAAIKWWDYIYGDEGARLYVFGKEGVTFEYAADGAIQFTDKVKQEAEDANKALLGYLGEKYGLFPGRSGIGPAFNLNMAVQHSIAVGEHKNLLQGRVVTAMNLAPLNNPPIWNTKDEGLRLAELLGNIVTYKKEMVSKFIVGQEPLSKWDEYVKRLDELGYKEVEELLNKGYERYLEKVGKSKGYIPKVEFDFSGLKKMVGME